MKRTIFILLLAVVSINAFSQRGDLTVGGKGGYAISNADLNYNGFIYGLDLAYHISNPLEIVFTGLLNPNISRKVGDNNENLAVYSANLDFRLYLINQREWATGPALGGQYYIVDYIKQNLGADKTFGFNIGWHLRVNLTDYVKLNGGWRYVNAKAKTKGVYNIPFDMSNHLIYLGVGYTFELR